MSFAILRTAKLKNLKGQNSIVGSAKHNFREKEVLNADSGRTSLNRTVGAQNTGEVLQAVEDRLKTVPTVRKNGVLAVEYFIGASPEWFAENNAEAHKSYFDEAKKWLEEKHGKENVISITSHMDEITPHLCAYVVPIDEKGHLNARAFFGGREKMSDMQTDFAERVGKKYGLNRGIEGSKAIHQEVARFYTQIQKETPKITVELPKVPKPTFTQKIAEGIGFETAHIQAVDKYEEAKEKRRNESNKYWKTVESKAKQYDIDKINSKKREERLIELRSSATQVRQIPLKDVLERLGASPDPADKNNWKTATGRLTITGNKFHNHDTGKGGGGSIDLVMAQLETNYAGAVKWLVNDFGVNTATAQVMAWHKEKVEIIAKAEQITIDPLKPHLPDTNKWEKIRNYLTNTRHIAGNLIDSLHEQGKIWADKFSNVVFKLGNGEGISLRGTGEKPFHGVRGKKSFFELKEEPGFTQKVAFVESTIDALSLRNAGFKDKIIATIGNSNEKAKKLAEYLNRQHGLKIISAFDNDRAGEAMGKALGNYERLKPLGKDWNEDLKADRKLTDFMTVSNKNSHRFER